MNQKLCPRCGKVYSYTHLPAQRGETRYGLNYYNCEEKGCGSTFTIYVDLLKAYALNNIPPTLEECRKKSLNLALKDVA